MKKELIELCLLHLLSAEDLYGYELIRRIYEAFPDTQKCAVYALLRNLYKEGFAEQYRGEKSGGPVRKYYRITKAGEEKRIRLMEMWCSLRDNLAALGVK